MSRTGAILPPEDDPDPTDRLPELDIASADGSGDPLEATGTWTVEGDVASVVADELEEQLAGRDAAIADLTSRLTQKTFALTRLEKELEQARSALLGARQAASEARGLEQRLDQVEHARAVVEAERDEQREAIGRLENQLSESRESEGRLERRVEDLSDQLIELQEARSVAEEKLAGSEARLAELEGQLAAATRETMTDIQRHEYDRLREHSAGLEQEVAAAEGRRATVERERDALRETLAQRDEEAVAAVQERDQRLGLLLEQLRSSEARRRIDADMRYAEEPAPDGDPQVAALSRELEEERSARQRLEGTIAGLQAERQRPAAAPQRRRLLRLDAGHEAAFLLLPPRTTIGRTPDNDLQLRENYISRTHAVVKLGADSAIIEDAGSRNGVFVNERRVQRELLHDGDVVVLGKAHFRFEVLPPVAD